ncbi:hypothetical protein JNJ66_02960 [Candidatus Saccharibacteria bacterium]|nr:hypothetical protein [Candidatus Saccharibacteria bacterium]
MTLEGLRGLFVTFSTFLVEISLLVALIIFLPRLLRAVRVNVDAHKHIIATARAVMLAYLLVFYVLKVASLFVSGVLLRIFDVVTGTY